MAIKKNRIRWKERPSLSCWEGYANGSTEDSFCVQGHILQDLRPTNRLANGRPVDYKVTGITEAKQLALESQPVLLVCLDVNAI